VAKCAAVKRALRIAERSISMFKPVLIHFGLYYPRHETIAWGAPSPQRDRGNL